MINPAIFALFLASFSSLGLQGCAAVAVSGAATGAAMIHDRRSAGTIIDDKGIELKSTHALTQKKELWKKSHISVISYNNALLLVGQVPNENFKQQANDAVQNIPKVRKVYNELTIGNPASLGTRSKDSWITTQIKTKMMGTKNINPTRVKVVTEEGVVYLLGLTTEDEELKATELARTVPGVEKVVQIFERN